VSLESQIARRRLKRKGPLAKVSALLTASAVSMVGLTVGLEPHIILWRALIAAIVIGSLVSFGLSVVDLANVTRNRT
jgi:hypothetical protein